MVKKSMLKFEGMFSMAVAAALLVGAGALLQFAFSPQSCNEFTGEIAESGLPDQQKAGVVKQFVDAAVAKASNKDVPELQLFDELTKEKSSLGGYLIGYQTETEGPTKIGTLVLHGVSTVDFCDASHRNVTIPRRQRLAKICITSRLLMVCMRSNCGSVLLHKAEDGLPIIGKTLRENDAEVRLRKGGA